MITEQMKHDLDKHCDLIPRKCRTWINTRFVGSSLKSDAKLFSQWCINGNVYLFYSHGKAFYLVVNNICYRYYYD